MCRELFIRKIKYARPNEWKLISDEGDTYKTMSDDGYPHWWTYLEAPSVHATKELGEDAAVLKCSVYSSNRLLANDYYLLTEYGSSAVLRFEKISEKEKVFSKSEEILIKSLMKNNDIRLRALTGAMKFTE